MTDLILPAADKQLVLYSPGELAGQEAEPSAQASDEKGLWIGIPGILSDMISIDDEEVILL